MRTAAFAFISLALTAAVIGNAFYQKKQFYPSVVYITKSNPCMAVIYIQALAFVILMGKLMRKLFFGQLRAAEFEHLMERSWYAVTETCLAFTVFRDDFSPKFVALFTVLLFLKSFHWLAEDRVDFMERSPVISWLFHLRILCLLVLLGSLDMHFVGHAYQSTVTKGASVQLVFGFEYSILLAIIFNIAIKYVLHTLDLQSDNPWENKAVFLLYTELAMGFIKVILYITFVAIMVRIYTLPLFAFRPMYYTMRAFNKAFNDVILSRRAINNMNTLYPDATQEELTAGDNVCIICREEMVTASKKLPCNHIFHTSCLRSWFQRQQTCPTCRLNILQTPGNQQPQQLQQQQPQPQGNQQQAQPQQPPAPPGGPFIPFGMMPPPPFWQPLQVPQQQQPTTTQPSANNSENQPETSSATFTSGSVPPFLYPPFPMLPFMVPPPMPNRDWSGLSDDELRALEGNTREAVEARLRVLQQVTTLLDVATVLVNQASIPRTASHTDNGQHSGTKTETSNLTIFPEAKPGTSTATTGQENQPSTSNVTTGQDAKPSTSTNVEDNSEQEEIRRRRLQKFSSQVANQE